MKAMCVIGGMGAFFCVESDKEGVSSVDSLQVIHPVAHMEGGCRLLVGEMIDPACPCVFFTRHERCIAMHGDMVCLVAKAAEDGALLGCGCLEQ